MIRAVAVFQLVVIFPAVLFLTSGLVGAGDPPQYELAHIAQRIGAWYLGWGLWAFGFVVILLPCVAFAAGGATLLRAWRGEHGTAPTLAALPAPLATLFIGWATLTSASIVAVVALHMLAN
jgi:hypothetical protein